MLALALGLIVSLVLLEVTASVLLHVGHARNAPNSPCKAGKKLIFEDLSKPNTTGCHRGVTYRTNDLGLRGPSVRTTKPANTFRILAIGDSVTVGQGVELDHTYPSRLQQALSKRRHSAQFEVINLGHGGYSLGMSLNRLRSIGMKLDPDLLVYGFTLNDLEGKGYRFPEGRTRRPFATSRSHLLRLAGPRVYALLERVWPPPSSYAGELDDNYFHNPQVWEKFERGLDALAALGVKRNVCVVALIHTHLFSLNGWHPFDRHYQAVVAAMEERGITTVESFAAFSGYEEEKLWVNPNDWHPNAQGHAILADVLLDHLEALPAQCGLPD